MSLKPFKRQTLAEKIEAKAEEAAKAAEAEVESKPKPIIRKKK